jgi:hypothetical protein
MNPAEQPAIVGQRYNPTENRVKADAGLAPDAGLAGESNQRGSLLGLMSVERVAFTDLA